MIRLAEAPMPDPPRRPSKLVRPVAGVLDDGTVFFAPVGEVVVEGSLVMCHLCGRSFRSVVAHLSSHGWTKQRYCETFGQERGQSLEGPQTRKLRAAAFTARLLFEPAVRDGSAAGRRRARTGDLARDAAAAARGRSFREQRRRKTVLARAAMPSAAIAQATSDRADRHLIAVAADAARRHGYPDIGSFVIARTKAGASLAAISREAGLHKDWLSRYLGRLDPAAAETARQRAAERPDFAWLPALRLLHYDDVAVYLRDRHVEQHLTVNAMAAETGFSHHAVRSALRRHGLTPVAHAAKRHATRQRAADVAASMDYPTVAGYISDRRSDGWSWKAISSESGQPETWLRRHAAGPESLTRPR
jgi:AraC-like DNA-binding protein